MFPSAVMMSIALAPMAHSQYAGRFLFVILSSPNRGRKSAEVGSICMTFLLHFSSEIYISFIIGFFKRASAFLIKVSFEFWGSKIKVLSVRSSMCSVLQYDSWSSLLNHPIFIAAQKVATLCNPNPFCVFGAKIEL